MIGIWCRQTGRTQHQDSVVGDHNQREGRMEEYRSASNPEVPKNDEIN